VLIINLPGAPAAAQQGLESILEILPHAVHALSGCALETHPEARVLLSDPIIVAELSGEPIDPEKVVDAIRRDDCGAVATFEGRARSPSEGVVVTSLEYEAYEERATEQLRTLGSEAIARFGLGGAAVIHRVGSLAPGDLAMLVATSAPHRGDAFDSVRWLVERVKADVAIWKKELTADGGRWVGL
ncbi:MAG TPA: molybdenum cofactor biosynthesis protein MoaE, partial [Actinomycetota bacterium]|nr:molybdenum cofactor biosynthesis protein MoaE [Actinomycetota bacterium]